MNISIANKQYDIFVSYAREDNNSSQNYIYRFMQEIEKRTKCRLLMTESNDTLGKIRKSLINDKAVQIRAVISNGYPAEDQIPSHGSTPRPPWFDTLNSTVIQLL